ncbi:phosphoribosyltransferase [Pandoraea sp. E26]|uniref:phosphoribosyltransferase n=1 Tax=Pandoraea sp. E26 TaxID=1427365 RepID=UPI00048D1B13|nr:phosphoribosyltransferase [Pandoraea sp. E26]
MQMLLTSPDAVLVAGIPSPAIAEVLSDFAALGNPVALLSNHSEPAWFKQTFVNSQVQFLRSPGRQDGGVVAHNAQRFNLKSHDVLVLASKLEDIQMAKNGRAVVIGAGWSSNQTVSDLGIRAANPTDLSQVIALTAGWPGQWWYQGNAQRYSVYALADLSQLGKGFDQQVFAGKLKSTVKGGGVHLNALLAVTARSLLMLGAGEVKNFVWGVYPSSNSSNTDDETLSDFTHRLRTTVSRVHYAKRGEPLFVRHAPSVKRSGSGYTGDRHDPTGQMTTVHLNPFYRKNGSLRGKKIVVVDDCTTYGVSFGVAAAFLLKAGAESVTGIALGKFGNRLSAYQIDLDSDPFAPVSPNNFTWSHAALTGASNSGSQAALTSLLT